MRLVSSDYIFVYLFIALLTSICVFKFILDCWYHLQNVWFGAVITDLGSHLADVLNNDLDEIHWSLRVTTDVGRLLRAIERYFSVTVNYAKGKGSIFMAWMRR